MFYWFIVKLERRSFGERCFLLNTALNTLLSFLLVLLGAREQPSLSKENLHLNLKRNMVSWFSSLSFIITDRKLF